MAVKEDPFVGEPVRAAATFRVRWSGRLYGGIGAGALLGLVTTGIMWFLPRHRSHLPAYSYVAVTDTDVHILELDYGSATSVKRLVGTWPISSLKAEALDNPRSVRIHLGMQTIDLEATSIGDDGTTVVQFLLAP